MNIELVYAAANFAREAHKGQTYGDGAYFDNHVDLVADLVSKHTSSLACLAAAYLHDVVEDCDVTLQDIADQFGPHVATIVGQLTHDDDRHYMDYLMDITSLEAKLIKYCDMMMNYRNARSDRARLKYEMGMTYLYRTSGVHLNDVPSPADVMASVIAENSN
jgi:(p)ppGpp synthase/HD superfamily hydrolase